MNDRNKLAAAANGACTQVEITRLDDPPSQPAGADETQAFLAIVNSLRDLPASAHRRVVDAAMMLLGSRNSEPVSVKQPTGAVTEFEGPAIGIGEAPIPKRASIWLSQSKLSLPELDSVFHRGEGGVELIAHEIPGRSNREKVRACYLLAGLRGFLEDGEARFTDDRARGMCRDLGCYDRANHATYVKALGNLVMGSKDSGFELTQPGLRAGAELVVAINSFERPE